MAPKTLTPRRRKNKAAKNNSAPKAHTTKSAAIGKLHAIANEATDQLVERDEMIQCLILSLISRQNALFLGVPGTAKTMGVQLIADSFCDRDEVFDILIAKTTKPEEVFGPTNVQRLVNDGVNERDTVGYLPNAVVGVLDEVFKGSPAILNGLLRIANERRFKNGHQWFDTPTRFLVGMSNEFPEDAAVLAAFFDRFPIKLMVNSIADDRNFTKVLCNGIGKPIATKMHSADLSEIDELVDNCELPIDVAESIAGIRMELGKAGITISDRRWVQAVRLMKAHAVYNYRTVVNSADLTILRYVCWNKDGEQSEIERILPNYSNPIEKEVRALREEAMAATGEVVRAYNVNGQDTGRKTKDTLAAVKAASAAVRSLTRITNELFLRFNEVEDEDTQSRLKPVIDEVDDMMIRVKGIATGGGDTPGREEALNKLSEQMK